MINYIQEVEMTLAGRGDRDERTERKQSRG